MRLNGRMKDGAPCRIEFEDRGDAVPCYDVAGLSYEGYTSEFRINGGPVVKACLDRRIAELEGEDAIGHFRTMEDLAVLETNGVDVGSLRFEEGGEPVFWGDPVQAG